MMAQAFLFGFFADGDIKERGREIAG